MTKTIRLSRDTILCPDTQQLKALQVAALCLRDGDAGLEVLLVTSRDTGRWIVPKGWPIDGKDGVHSALQEAWEEAGVKPGDYDAQPIGYFSYLKRLNDGQSLPVHTELYRVEVDRLASDFPESDERTRKWMSPAKAAEMVDEPDLREILLDLSA